jgi:amino acid adenylation domain-containing protein
MMPSTVRREHASLNGADQLIAAPAGPRLESVSTQPTILPREESGPVPLSFAQERLWFLEQINPGDASGAISRAIRITGQLKQDLLQRALQAVISRHESLRTTFATNQLNSIKDSKPLQLIASQRTVEIPVIDLSHEPVNQREAKARDLAQNAVQQPFDLTLGPLLRAVLFRLDEREHVLLLNLHRIICDDWSLQILVDELWAAYEVFANGGAWSNSPLPIQYADYALWQRKQFTDESAGPALDFWRANLQGAPTVLELPTDRPRPPVRSWHGRSVSVELKNELVAALESIAASEGSTLPIVLLAALKVVLARHSRQNDLVVGYTVSNRTAAETKHMVGPLSSPLSLHTNLSSDTAIAEVLSQLQTAGTEAQMHFVPFEKLLEQLELEPSLSHAPVFQVSFSFQPANNANEAAGLKLEEFKFDDGVARFDLAVDVFEKLHRLECCFRYSTDLFDQMRIERLSGHFKTVLEGIVRNSNERVSALPLLTETERKQILVDWNSTGKVFAGEAQCIPQLFEAQVELTPDVTAAIFETEQLTYAELNRRANQLAHHLRKRGVGPETLVGICLKRSLEMIVGLLGILKAGGAYVPLDPAYPTERLHFMLQDSGARLLLTEEPIRERIADRQVEVICIDTDWPKISNELGENLATKPETNNLAYVIYTSGSTGTPKGVAIEHRSAAALLAWARDVFSTEELSGVLASTSICFDLSVFELFMPLSCGGKIVLANDILHLLSLPSAREVKLINTVPSAMVELLHLGGIPSSVRTVNLAGEPLPASLVDEIYKQTQVERVFDLYGPSEDTTYSTFAPRLPQSPATIGRPISNTRVYLLDQDLQPVPIGVPGELYLAGAGLARGYLNRPEVTATAFVPDPFGANGRLYKTGDLARYLADGKIEYLGRIDRQVKIRGFRIEPGEIEAAFRRHSSVRDVAVVARQGKLVAYVVPVVKPAGDVAKLWNELRGFIKASLPEYMSPAIFVALDALPLTPNGKVDRGSLPLPDESQRDVEQIYVAPRDQLEEQLVTLWANVLERKSIGINDNFFELGGNSLLAARLFAQIDNRLGRHLPLAALFKFPTVEQLANSLRDSDTSKPWSSLVAIQPEGSRPPLFCVHAAGANVLIYRPLSRHLGNDQPVFALQAQGLDGRTSPLTTVEEMAALYLSEIRAVQPRGPYFLLGASFGGLVIYEMAQQLLAQDQEVALLVMLNTNCPVYSFAKRIQSHVGHLMEYGPKRYVSAAGKGVKRRLTGRTANENNAAGKSGATDPEIQKLLTNGSGVDESLVRTVAAILSAEERYAPARQEYPGKITLFWARDATPGFDDNRPGWRRMAAGGFDLHIVPGTHTSMREEPHVAELAKKLKSCLDQAQ